MIILGVNAYHSDSSACLLIDGKIVNAIEEERFKRIKHWAGLPIQSISWCLANANLTIQDVDYIAISRNPLAHIHKKVFRTLTNLSMHKFIRSRFENIIHLSNIKSEIAKGLNIHESLIKAKIQNIEHHIAHIASAFYVSPFEEAACLSVDGFGDFVSTMRGLATSNKIKIFDFVEYPHSLGIFYSALTQYLGFWEYGDEYKVMGLSAYGEPVYLNEMREIVKLQSNGLFKLDTSFFTHDKEGVEMFWNNEKPVIGKLFSDKLIKTFGEARKEDIAASLQAMYEEAFFHLLNDTYKKTKVDTVVLAGGCLQNSLANGKIYKRTPFKKVYIPPASYDAGTAIGAGMVAWNKRGNTLKRFEMKHSYFGPSFSEEEIEFEIEKVRSELNKSGFIVKFIASEDVLCNKVAKHIASGMIVGWFQGKTEWGPRALGNRSILVDPRKKEMKEILNERIKRREWFRPFAASIIEEKAREWFDYYEPVPFMEKVYYIKKTKQDLIPAVCHIDGTGRLQTVSYNLNPRYYKLIKGFDELTGIPILLNTSFNDNEPIVNSPNEALRCFLATKMDVLVLENFLISSNE
ncbi:MAG: carbamoyltransferase [Candidatus Melainabacteria bacterium]|nr:carbamoyltransferase [Candidatus Melainabacteria bacterium]